jgi:flagellin
MALSVNTNIAALNAYRNLSATQGDLGKSLEKLSSGLRINRAADDAAGLAISEGLRAQIGGTTQAVRNAQDGISVVQTAEGALTETHSILQRMRTLSVQASNDGGLSNTAKGNIQDEIGQLTKELDRIATTTSFNGKSLLNGSYTGSFQVGANTGADNKIEVGLAASDIAAFGIAGVTGVGGVSTSGLGLTGIDVTAGATQYSGTVDLFGAAAPATATLEINGNTFAVDLTGWNTGADADAAKANKALVQSAMSTALQSTEFTAKVDEYGSITLGGAEVTSANVFGAAATSTVIAGGGANAAIEKIDNAITAVSKVRSSLGAVQNRFDHTINNLNVAVENLTASESRIRDTDMASEMVSYTRASILSQAGTAMLAQAKSLPQSVLQLLQ